MDGLQGSLAVASNMQHVNIDLPLPCDGLQGPDAQLDSLVMTDTAQHGNMDAGLPRQDQPLLLPGSPTAQVPVPGTVEGPAANQAGGMLQDCTQNAPVAMDHDSGEWRMSSNHYPVYRTWFVTFICLCALTWMY
jgi:hypothetical protein